MSDTSDEPIPASYEALEARARDRLPTDLYDYIAAGAGAEATVRANREAFDRWRIVPRVLRDVRERDASIELFGEAFDTPLLLAPVANQAALHAEAEAATARAARSLDVPFVVTTGASRTFEEIADTLGETPRWLQVHATTDRGLLDRFVDRAEAADYGALVVTVDTTTMGFRERLADSDYDPRTAVGADAIANYQADPVFRSGLDAPVEDDLDAALARFKALGHGADPVTWDTLDELGDRTDLPLVLKGIVHPDDAERAAAHDAVDGLVVSTHGGRQVDGAIAALDALDRVSRALDGRLPLLFDSGIRRGSDVFKALALGADAVLLGRPYVYGLALGGASGVEAVVGNVLEALDRTMALSGCPTIDAIDRDALARVR